MKKLLFIVFLLLTYAFTKAQIVIDTDVYIQASEGVREILSSHTWQRTDNTAQLTFRKDNVYQLCLDCNHPIQNTISAIWLADATTFTVVVDQSYIKHYIIESINRSFVKLKDEKNSITILRAVE